MGCWPAFMGARAHHQNDSGQTPSAASAGPTSTGVRISLQDKRLRWKASFLLDVSSWVDAQG